MMMMMFMNTYTMNMIIKESKGRRAKKMFNQDEGKIECAVGNREICVWQSKKAEIVLILFLTSGFAVSGSWYCQIQTT